MTNHESLKFTKSHEWVLIEGDKMKIGLSDFAQDQLGDIVFVDFPEEGDTVTKGESFADIESVKAVSEVFSPVTGVISAINEALTDSPELINTAPHDSWLIEVEQVGEMEELLSAADYQAFCEEAEEA